MLHDENDEEDDIPRLSAETLAALQEFYLEEEQRNMEEDAAISSTNTNMPKEDWQLSQFWYDEGTARTLANECISSVGENGRVAFISSPTIFAKLKELHPDISSNSVCLEYDRRFSSIFGLNYIFYDYNEPLNLPESLKSSFDLVVLDPPFLSEECLEKSAKTAQYLTNGKILLCTGTVMEDAAYRLLNVKRLKFTPKHSNNLSNEFSCFSNFDTKLL
ncbi:hypothetical protein HELRODRAFT_157178 [Helobdella robusta]|uniref:Protein-lysine N-methyltransferase HELRODRAFT_157178 n=1 Tax=Helobdella robusta TaxID=6412 RepID=T1EM76_HELRO|nr:hypothetical protein HELRODRAFT_157178 [Helobdella robusta]ESO01522.1 hypothetical protein HELRODRAFT_157178 [Helobdella robusta]